MYRRSAGIALLLAVSAAGTASAAVTGTFLLTVTGRRLFGRRRRNRYRQCRIFLGYLAGILFKIEGSSARKAYCHIKPVEALYELADLGIYTESGKHLLTVMLQLINHGTAVHSSLRIIEKAVHVVSFALQETGYIKSRFFIEKFRSILRIYADSAAFKLGAYRVSRSEQRIKGNALRQTELEYQRIIGFLMHRGENIALPCRGIKIYVFKQFFKFCRHCYLSFHRVLSRQ